MEYKMHMVQGEEKLSSIAEKYNTNAEAIKILNPTMRTVGGFLMGGTFVAHGQLIKIPITEKKVIQSHTRSHSDALLDTFVFTSKARYRCEQINSTKVNNTLTSYINQKTQYLLEQNLEEKYVRTELEEFLYEVIPPRFG